MKEVLQQQLSAFVDGELAQAEAQMLLRQMEADPALLERARQYQRIGSVLRNEPDVAPVFAERIRAEVLDITLDSPGASQGIGWKRLAAGSAIAATVALLALAGLNLSVDGDSTKPTALTAGIESTNRTEESFTVPAPDTLPAGVQAQIEPRMVTYMLRHGRIAPVISGAQLREAQLREARQRAATQDEAREDATRD